MLSYRGYGPAGPPRGQWACPPVGAAYGGCTAGRWGERDRRSELRFCARATSSENADRRPQRPRPSSYLSTGDCHRLFECSPKSNPRETDRKHQALTVYPRQVIYFFPPARPGVCRRAASAARMPGACAAGSRGGREQRVGVCPTSARSSSRPARTCVQRVPVGRSWAGPGTGMEWRHSVPRPASPPHWRQRGAGGCGV